MKNTNILSNTTLWADENNLTIENKMKVKSDTIPFRNTFRVETKEVFDKLIQMKKGHWILFKQDEARVLNNALLKIQREQFNNRLQGYHFVVFKNELKKGRVMVGRSN
jgi:hypothetical protein